MQSTDFDRINFQPPFQPRDDGIYRIEEFEALYDRQFVAAMYLAILRREPDANGEAHYLDQVRSGQNKAKLLDVFLRSAEAARYSTVIRGLDARLRWIRIFEFPVIGPVVAALFFLLNINDHMRDLRAIENHVIRMAEETQRANEANLRKILPPN